MLRLEGERETVGSAKSKTRERETVGSAKTGGRERDCGKCKD